MKNIISVNKNIYLESFNGKTIQVKKLFTMLNNRKYNISNDSKTDYKNHKMKINTSLIRVHQIT